ncbi:PAS/PAC sensor signal transduction histidine kinase [Fervidobacterium changbaicum]|uniref:histidine kinase n=1 Tax=Fervidobacterium changbaicum TaxID=310769 RepID=A0ABX5QST4_9BACT|nr:sensor histidine kinase [Fervidobacterium changbaicum]QAV33165.1 PAS domain-containing protein [Fervidobacterium changbaicum]SDH12372.1 PAS/PAC sensor signal transduction histidine kinase [Fervidobacterium changbaicum]
MIGKKICYALTEIFEKDKYSTEAENTANLLAEFVGVDKISVAIYEKSKDIYRVLISNFLPLQTKVPVSEIGDRNSLSKLTLKLKDGITVDAYVEQLIHNTPETGDEKVGIVMTNQIPKKMANFAEIVDFLAYSLWFIPSYEKSKSYLSKYRSLWMLTNLFESAKSHEELLDGFVKVISEIIEAEITAVLNFPESSDEGLNIIIYDSQTSRFVHKDLDISKLTDEAMRYFKGMEKIVYKPDGLSELFSTKVLSALIVPGGDYWFIFANKKSKEIYLQTKSFDSMDLDLARDSVKRFILAKGRIEFEQKLEEEVAKLRELQKMHEALIEEQKEQIKRMNAVHYISQAMRTMYSVKNVYKTLLLGLTSGRLLGYNRALLLTYDEQRDVLIGKMWMGPDTENVEEDWKKANLRAMRYADVVQYLREEAMTLEINNKLTQQIENRIFPYKAHPILEKCVVRKKIFVANERIIDTMGLEAADLVNLLGTKEFAAFPLVGREGVFGVVIVDNYFTKKRIKESDIDILKILSDSAGLAIETAQNYEELRNKTISLERQKSLIEYLREFSDSVLQNMSSAIIVIDKEGKVTEWNKRAEVYFNRPKEQMTGVELRTLGSEFEDIEEMAIQSMKIKEEITLSNYLIQTGGRERYYDVKITPFWDADKLMLRGVIITLDDVTERVNLEKERKKQEKLAALGEMAARVAHELRNPVSVLGGFIKRLEKNVDNPEARNRYIKIIADEILRLEQIVNEILDFSREPRSLEFRYFNLNKLVNDVYILLDEKIREKNILFTFETDAEEIIVYAEYSRMKQVVINLLQNAIEATPKDGKILVETRVKFDKIVLSVWNEGTPIDKETAEKLFTPFFTTKVQGTGLGLAICKKIVEDEHKGKIYHEATEDGNRFVVELPKPEITPDNEEK